MITNFVDGYAILSPEEDNYYRRLYANLRLYENEIINIKLSYFNKKVNVKYEGKLIDVTNEAIFIVDKESGSIIKIYYFNGNQYIDTINVLDKEIYRFNPIMDAHNFKIAIDEYDEEIEYYYNKLNNYTIDYEDYVYYLESNMINGINDIEVLNNNLLNNKVLKISRKKG
jgi:hypothetical protein